MLSQVVNGGVLPFVLIFMLLLINNKETHGESTSIPAFQRHRVGDDRHHDRADAGVALEHAAERRVEKHSTPRSQSLPREAGKTALTDFLWR